MNGLTSQFYQQISKQFGNVATNILKDISRSKLKLANALNRRNFLLRCKSMNIVPNCCNIKIQHLAATNHRDYNKTHRVFCNKLLSFEINETIKNIKELETNINQNIDKLQNKIDHHIIQKFCYIQDIKFHYNYNKIKNTNIQKFHKLLQKNDAYKLLDTIKSNTDKWLINKSSITIPDNVTCILALGPEFHHIDYNNKRNIKKNCLDTLASIENSLSQIKDIETNNFRHKITNILTRHLFTINNKHIHCSKIILTQAIKQTKQFIKKHPNLIVTTADKGNITVLLNKHDYDSKVEILLNDTKTYKLLKTDPTNKFQLTTNKLISDINKDKLLTYYEEQKLKTHNAVSPKLYCCPKIHKPDWPLRPIVANIQTPNSSLSKYLSNILSPLKYHSPYFIDSSFSLIEKLRGIYVPNGFKLISLDVTSLFTCIPHHLMIESIEARWPDIAPHTEIPFIKFMSLIKHCLNTSYFQHNNNFYLQTTGMPMGSSLSPVIAEIVMFHLESKILKDHPEFNILFYHRYVDDTVACLPEEYINDILDAFNAYNHNIQFTLEMQNNNSINFLDITITLNNNNITTNWYHKPTWSGRYLHFDTDYPMKYKRAVVHNLVDRAIKLSDQKHHIPNRKIIIDTLVQNGYPRQMLKRIIKDRTKTIQNSAMNDSFQFPPNANKKIYCRIPYQPNLHKPLYNLLNEIGITIAYTSANNTKQFYTRLKDKDDPTLQSNVVYKITCNTCNKNYIGETKQYIHKRIKQHEYNAKINNNKHSALTEHTFNTLHSPHYNNYNILHTETNRHKRLFLEFVYIHTTPETLNIKSDINDSLHQYQPIFKLLQTQ